MLLERVGTGADLAFVEARVGTGAGLLRVGGLGRRGGHVAQRDLKRALAKDLSTWPPTFMISSVSVCETFFRDGR